MLHELEMRQVYCQTLIELAEENPDIMVVEADLMRASGTLPFSKKFPERAFDVGVAEQNLIGIAAGLAVEGKIPFAATFSPFATRRPCDQIAVSVAYANTNVKIVGTAPGITAEYNGGTHMSFEDLAIMRSFPNMTILIPCDVYELQGAVRAAAAHRGPVYLQLIRGKMPKVFDEGSDFIIGKAKVLREGKDVTICASGYMVHLALKAADLLTNSGINATVINVSTLKPLDTQTILEAAQRTGCVVTAENHSVLGGLGSMVCELLAEKFPAPIYRVGVRDQFGEVGKLSYLLERFLLRDTDIARACCEVIKRK